MTIDERLDRLTARHEALTQTVELIARAQVDNDKRFAEVAAAQAKNEVLMAQVLESVNSLARIALSHEQRITNLEGNRPQ